GEARRLADLERVVPGVDPGLEPPQPADPSDPLVAPGTLEVVCEVRFLARGRIALLDEVGDIWTPSEGRLRHVTVAGEPAPGRQILRHTDLTAADLEHLPGGERGHGLTDQDQQAAAAIQVAALDDGITAGRSRHAACSGAATRASVVRRTSSPGYSPSARR